MAVIYVAGVSPAFVHVARIANLQLPPDGMHGCGRHLVNATIVVCPSQLVKVEARPVLRQHSVTANDRTHRSTFERS